MGAIPAGPYLNNRTPFGCPALDAKTLIEASSPSVEQFVSLISKSNPAIPRIFSRVSVMQVWDIGASPTAANNKYKATGITVSPITQRREVRVKEVRSVMSFVTITEFAVQCNCIHCQKW